MQMAGGKRLTITAALLGLAMMSGPLNAMAADFNDPTWPCVQRKVMHLSIGQMWSGPLVDETADWRKDDGVRELAPRLAARRLELDEAKRLIAVFAENADDTRLSLLFSAVFDIVDSERSRLMGGIGRYSGKQIEAAKAIDGKRDEIAVLRENTADDDFDGLDRIDELEDELVWRTRIYDDRRQSLIYVCESPVLMEKRAFALARMIQEHLSS